MLENNPTKKKNFLIAFGGVALLVLGSILFFQWNGAQKGPKEQPKESFLIGIVSLGGVTYAEPIKGLKEGMEALGYKEGESVTYHVVDAAGSLDKAKEGAKEFLREHVDVVHSLSTPVTQQVKEVIHDIPVVFNIVGDPIAPGFAKSLRSSGTNFTGCSVGQFSAKRLEILKSLLPNAHKVLTLYDPKNAYSQQSIALLRDAAPRLGVTLVEKQVQTRDDLIKIMNEISAGEYDAFLNFGEVKVSSAINVVVDRANAINLPTLGPAKNAVQEGMLIGYGPSWLELGRQCARVIDKVLHGVKPTDIPIQSPAQLELTVNTKTAQRLGITFPQSELIRIDSFIE